MSNRLSCIFWSSAWVTMTLACGRPAAKEPSQGSATATTPADGSERGESAQGQFLKQMHAGCFDRCVETQGNEAACDKFCTCLFSKVAENKVAMRELTDPKTQAPPSAVLQDAIVDATASCSASSSLQQREYDPRALRSLVGTKVNVVTDHTPAPTPPAKVFDKVTYPAPLGANVAYVTPIKKGQKRPAILWLAGGFDWGLADTFWLPAPRSNDQSARAFRDANIVLMLPALRGSNENPGHNECFFGEVEDVLAAAEFLAKRPDVDPNRVYLGGHSTGATLALLSAQSTKRFRAVFAFGPVADPRQYGESGCMPDGLSTPEVVVRAPLSGMAQLTTPTFILEGLAQGNIDAIAALREGARPTVQFIEVPGATHFSVLSPGSAVVARAIHEDTGEAPNLKLSAPDIVAELARAK